MLCFVLVRIIGSCGTIAEDAVISGKGNHGFGAFIREIRVFVDEILKQGDQVIGTDQYGAVIQLHLICRPSVLPDNHLGGKTVFFHIFIITDIVLRHDKGLFARRQHNVAFHKVRIAVLPCCLVSYVVKPDKYKPPVVHGLKNFHKFILGSHHLVIALLPGVSVKRLGGVYNQGVEEDMSHLLRVGPHESGFILFISGNSRCDLFVRSIGTFAQHGDSAVIVVSCGQKTCP